ncbi:DEAD/DEAH box helicase [Bacillus sp. 2205SS5-2]|uniref:DEAD/DEAH box helicase n=1 Tax=Bacillus sp. 2205SS5-2 TaxID=3109031 RepID=UPI00300579C1
MSHQFNKFSFKPFINEAIKEAGFQEPTEIQEKIIPTILKGESAIGQSQTGTGKTHSFLLPILQKINVEQQTVQAVITAPTRELAQQLYQATIELAKHSDEEITVRNFIGGTDKQRAITKLKNQPHIVVGTPGRISDLMKEQALFVHTATMLVVDEADLMLDMGFILDVDKIAAKMPSNLQILVFSATLPEKLKPFLKKYMENPVYTHVQPKQVSAQNIQHVVVPQKSRDKINLLVNMLKSYNPYLSIVFTNTKAKAEEVADKLNAAGLKVGRIHGDLSPRERKQQMKQIRNLDYQFIVATDLAARGIDIEGVSHVINFELPKDLDFYIHRAGRTARAGFSGIAATIYTPSDEDALVKLEKLGIKFVQQDLKKGEWVELGELNKRSKRQKTSDSIDEKAKTHINKPKKVKPGYKRKMKWQMDEIKKKERRIKNRNK